jgi:hypothetical protein
MLLVALFRQLQEDGGASFPRLLRKRIPNGSNHAEVRIALESEGVMAGRDPNFRRHLKDGFKADSFLADEACALASAAFGALADAADGLNVLLAEAPLIAVDSDPP